MDLVAAQDFFNAKSLKIKSTDTNGKLLKGFKHADIVHKGYRFNLGGEVKSIKTLQKTDNATAQDVATLVAYGLAVVDDDSAESKDAIARIDQEVEIEKATAAAQAAAQADQETLQDRIVALEKTIALLNAK